AVARAREQPAVDEPAIERRAEVRAGVVEAADRGAAAREDDAAAADLDRADAAVGQLVERHGVRPAGVVVARERADVALVALAGAAALHLPHGLDLGARLADGLLDAGLQREERRRAAVAAPEQPELDG